MTLKVYIASITANTEIRKQVQRVMMVLDGMGVDYEAVDITLPGKENEREYMRSHGKPREGQSVPLPPQIFFNDDYIGDYEAFDNAVEDNQLLYFLRLTAQSTPTTHDGPAVSQMNGETANGHGEKDEEDVVEGGDEDVEDEGEGEEGEEGEGEEGEGEEGEGEEGEEGEGEGEEGAGEEGEKAVEAKVAKEEEAADGEEDEEIVEDPEIDEEEGEDEANADEEEEEDVEDVEIEDEEEDEGANAVSLHCVTSLVDCTRTVTRRHRH